MLSHTAALAKLQPGKTRKARKLRATGVGPHIKLLGPATLDGGGVLVPLRLISEANVSQREHWAVKHKRTKRTRAAVSDALRGFGLRPSLPCTVTITRCAPRRLDSDNAVRAAKAVRDEVAAWLGVDDADPRITWRYAQERAAARTYGVKISWSAP